MNRRQFIQRTAATVTLAAAVPSLFAQEQKREIHKAIMYATVGVPGTVAEKFKAIKTAGFAGVEAMSHMNQDEVLKARDEAGLIVPSVCCSTHWKENLASPDASMRQRGLDGLKQALQDAKRYGATSVLFVPAVVSKDVPYADAYKRSQEELKKAVPLAEELGVKIALENVWNNFLLSPLEAARYVDEMNSKAVGWHFDVGNVLRYGWPEQWIEVLGNRIQKLHIKEFSRTKMNNEGLWKGFDVKLMEGDNHWPKVMKALDKIGYKGWAMAEQGGADSPEGMKDIADRMGKIFAS